MNDISLDITGSYQWSSGERSVYDQDNYIILKKMGEKVEGYYYGNTGEFSTSRTGLWPGYFVLKMEDLFFTEDSIKFILKPKREDFFNEPVRFTTFNSKDVLKDGNSRWDYVSDYSFLPIKRYTGFFSDSTIIWMDKDEFSDNKDRKFVKKTSLHSNGNQVLEQIKVNKIQADLKNAKSYVAVLSFDALFIDWMKENKTPIEGEITRKDIQLINGLLKESINKYNTHYENMSETLKKINAPITDFENKYVIQIVPYLNSTGEREAFVNCVCKEGVRQDWRKELIMVEGGGSCYFRIIINLDKKTSKDFWVNFSR